MSVWIIPPVAGFIDNGMAPEIYIDGIGAIEFLNGNIRVYLIAEQARLANAKEPEHSLVTAKIIGPATQIPQVIGQLAQCLWQPRGLAPARGTAPHLVP